LIWHFSNSDHGGTIEFHRRKKPEKDSPLQQVCLDSIFTHMGEHENDLDAVFAALAHPSRRKMLALLSTNDLCVTELASHFPGALNVVSKHVKSLERAGLVKRHCEGRVHRLEFAAAPLADASDFIERYRARWERQLDRLAGYLDELHGKKKRHGKSKTDP
jgi:DNA-binding transcriptional ArsR family regulator